MGKCPSGNGLSRRLGRNSVTASSCFVSPEATADCLPIHRYETKTRSTQNSHLWLSESRVCLQWTFLSFRSFVIWKVLIAAYFVIWLGLSVGNFVRQYAQLSSRVKWLVYLTNWTYLIFVSYLIVTAFNVVRELVLKRRSMFQTVYRDVSCSSFLVHAVDNSLVFSSRKLQSTPDMALHNTVVSVERWGDRNNNSMPCFLGSACCGKPC